MRTAADRVGARGTHLVILIRRTLRLGDVEVALGHGRLDLFEVQRLDGRGPVGVVHVGQIARLVDTLAHECLGVLGYSLGVEAAVRCHPVAELLDLRVLGVGGGFGLVRRLLFLVLLDSEPARGPT
jgi:hypothetical protein